MCRRVASLFLFVNIVSFRIDARAPCHLSCWALYFVSSELVIFAWKTVLTRLLVTVILSAGETLEFCIQRAAGQGWRLDRTPAVERELTQKHDLVEIFQIFQTVTEAVSMGGRGGYQAWKTISAMIRRPQWKAKYVELIRAGERDWPPSGASYQ